MRETFPRGNVLKKSERSVCCCVVYVWRIKATRINSGFCNTTRAFFFSFASTLIVTHYDANLFFQNWKTQTGIGCERIYSQYLRNFETTQHVFQVFVGFFFSFGIDSRKKMSTNKKEKKKRPDERNTRIIMPRKETWVFSYVRHFPPKSFLKRDYTMKTLQSCTSTKEISFFCWFTILFWNKPYTRSDYHNSYQIDSFVEDTTRKIDKKMRHFAPLALNKDNNFLDNI